MPKRTIFQLIRNIGRYIGVVAALAFVVVTASALAAPTETVLHSFGVVPNGNNPQAPLLASGDGGFYGTTSNGGAGGVGTVFKMIPPAKGETGWQHIVLYSFRNDGSDGANPYASVIADKNGALYGTTNVGGTAGVGTVYKLAPPAPGGTDWTETVLYSFKNDGIDGGNPEAPLILDATGALYGTTTGGLSNKGTAFKLTPPEPKEADWTETVIYPIGNSFGALVAGKHGTLYGTTSGLSTYDGGSVFKLTPPAKGARAWTMSTLHSFTGIGADYAGGYSPGAGLIIDASGTLYGTTMYTYSPDLGSTAGTVFSLTPPARGGMWKFSQLGFRLSPIFAPVIADASGNLYGSDSITIFGKTYGEVFKLKRPASDKAG